MSLEWAHTSPAQQVRFGEGISRRLRPLLRECGLRRAMFVSSSGRAGSDDGQTVADGLGRLLVSRFDRVQSHCPTEAVQEAVRQALTDQIDAVVSYGGGAAIDTAKAVAHFVEVQAGTPGASFADQPAILHIAVPTTHCGAEATSTFAMTQAGHKAEATSPTTTPRWAIYDPALLASVPSAVRLETGFAALGNALDAVLAPVRTPEAEALGLAAVGRVVGALSAMAADPEDPGSAASLQLAGMLAARARQNAMPGLAYAVALALGGRSGVRHGLALSLVVPAALRFNAAATELGMAQVATTLGVDDVADAIDELRSEAGISQSLADAGVSDADADAVSRLVQQSPSVQRNPRPAGESDVRAILESLL